MLGIQRPSILGASIALLLSNGAQALPNCASGSLASNGICNTSLSPNARAAALVAAMQDSEKLANLVSKSPGVSRLGLPAYNWWSEALHGIAGAPGTQFTSPTTYATSFPEPVLMAAAFDDDLIYQVGTVIGIEGRAFADSSHSAFDFWAPNVNAFRDPRWGRGGETPGEDILRIKRYADSFVRGMEGNQTDVERRVIATCKHYAGYDLEQNRYAFNAQITPQDLAEYYMPPFQQCARDSKVGSIMCSYNAVNGVPACADSYLMNTILRDHWNWTADNNYITSDCEAVSYISNSHHYASSNAAGTADAFNAGMDTSCEYSGSSDINGAWNQKLLNSTTVNRALTRLFQGLVRVGYFDGSKALYSSIGASSINTASAQQVALLAAQEAIVLTKNDGTLPLPLKAGSKVAMIGFWADTGADLQGGYSGTAPFLHTPAYAARQAGYSVTVATGPNQSPGSDTWTTNAVAAAQKSDYIIFFGGLDPNAAGEGNDRSSLSWPTAQITLIQKLAALNKPLVVVQSGDQLDDTQLLSTAGVNGIFWASFPGQDGGTAIMNLISGAAAPAGRLPVTKYPANYTKVNIGDMSLRPSGSNPGRTYRWYSTPVQPFGTGLHYTTFNTAFGAQAGNMSYNIQSLISGCSKTYPDTCPIPALPVSITNAGNRTSDFVALVFVQSQTGPTPYPLKTLVAYSRLKAIAPAQTSTAYLSWTLGDLARRDSNGNNILYPGTYTLLLDQPTQKTVNFTLTGTAATLETWPKAP